MWAFPRGITRFLKLLTNNIIHAGWKTSLIWRFSKVNLFIIVKDFVEVSRKHNGCSPVCLVIYQILILFAAKIRIKVLQVFVKASVVVLPTWWRVCIMWTGSKQGSQERGNHGEAGFHASDRRQHWLMCLLVFLGLSSGAACAYLLGLSDGGSDEVIYLKWLRQHK